MIKGVPGGGIGEEEGPGVVKWNAEGRRVMSGSFSSLDLGMKLVLCAAR